MLELTVPFLMRGVSGEIDVQIESGADLTAGSATAEVPGFAEADWAWARAFPACTATVSHPARGYDAICGWIQFVRSTDSSQPQIYEMDPLPFTHDLELPYCWYGTRPILFDAPSRESRQDLVWRAHSFLCASPGVIDRTVAPLAGFSWGFDVKDGAITFAEPAILSAGEWTAHLGLLDETFPRWTFLAGDSDGPSETAPPGTS